MKPDKYKRQTRASSVTERMRHQIALEAARRLMPQIGPAPGQSTLRDASADDYYAAKRRAAAVLGLRVRPGDLPSDTEVREQAIALVRSGQAEAYSQPEPAGDESVHHPAEHLDRFTLYRMRLEPLETVKQNPKSHPEGDVLYHSLQVFDRAREARPYDEEMLLAALLHDVGKAIDPDRHPTAAVEALGATITPRTAWLIAHHSDTSPTRLKAMSPRERRELESSEWHEDLLLLRELDEAGRVPGAPTGTIDDALDYLRQLEHDAESD